MTGMIRTVLALVIFASTPLSVDATQMQQAPKKSTDPQAILTTTQHSPAQQPKMSIHRGLRSPAVSRYIKHPTRRLISDLSHSGVTIATQGSRVMLVMPELCNFSQLGSTVNIPFMNILDKVAKVMMKYPYTIAGIHGYADKEGSAKAQLALSQRRAHAVIAYLESRGIPGNRLVTVGHGDKPFPGEQAYKNRALKNRRVAISLHSFTHRNFYDFRG